MSILQKLTHKELIKLAHKKCIPPLLSTFHKGQTGRVCIIGGCEDYTGAPYFSANATALMGCDLTHVICERQAAPVIKSYTPNLMVHPYLSDNFNEYPSDLNKIKGLLERMHAIVLGPGLGRNENMFFDCKQIIKFILEEHNGSIPMVIDADGLYLLSTDKDAQNLIKRFPPGKIILTPNVVEFERLFSSVFPNEEKKKLSHPDKVALISKAFNCIVFGKGESDFIAFNSGEDSILLQNSIEGSNKRVGGQGDTLTGTIACMLAYSRSIHDLKLYTPDESDSIFLTWVEYAMLSSYVGSTITRTCSKLAYEEKGRAMQTTDMNNYVGKVFEQLFF